MKAILVTLVVIGVSGIGAAHAERGTRDPGVNARQHHQRERVQQGVRSGELTHEEAKGVREDRREIRQKEREYKSDGKLTASERADLHRDQNEASREIYKEKHDDEKRPQ
jgi:hypothetical protein